MPAARLLVLSSRAGGLNAETEAHLRHELSDHTVVRFGAVKGIRSLVTPNAKVVVAGGDGTVGAVVRRLADTRCRIGVIPLGTFNNFAMSLRVPADLDKAIEVAQGGRVRRDDPARRVREGRKAAGHHRQDPPRAHRPTISLRAVEGPRR